MHEADKEQRGGKARRRRDRIEEAERVIDKAREEMERINRLRSGRPAEPRDKDG